MALAAARKKTPGLARRWGYLMNMGLNSFASAFAKHTEIAWGCTAIIDPVRLRGHVLTMVEQLFPVEFDTVEKRLAKRGE